MSFQPAKELVTWYKQHQRRLPWRETKDPYAILVSETMLQQTRVETVIPYYHAFLNRFPDVYALAGATDDEVLKLWQGLGYYSRALNLKKAARKIVSEHGGVVPDEIKQLLALPGVGPYTAGAIASIAYEKPEPAVDGNVLRVISRYSGLYMSIDSPEAKRTVTNLVHEWVLTESPSLFTQSLMELGATVCTPKSPKCEICPIREGCAAYETGKTDVLPVRAPKKQRKVVHLVAFWVENDRGILLEKRKDKGLLANMWQLPSVEISEGEETVSDRELDRLLSQVIPVPEKTDCVQEEKLYSYVQIGQEKHIFTHVEWYVHVFRPVGLDVSNVVLAEQDSFQFSPRESIQNYVLPRVFEKLIGTILGRKVR